MCQWNVLFAISLCVVTWKWHTVLFTRRNRHKEQDAWIGRCLESLKRGWKIESALGCIFKSCWLSIKSVIRIQRGIWVCLSVFWNLQYGVSLVQTLGCVRGWHQPDAPERMIWLPNKEVILRSPMELARRRELQPTPTMFLLWHVSSILLGFPKAHGRCVLFLP